jgi:hypothetical protein
MHASVGFTVHFDRESRRTSGHVALGGALGAFRQNGYMLGGPIDIGVSSRIVGNDQNALGIVGSVLFPYGHVGDPDGKDITNDSAQATFVRTYVGLGYRRGVTESRLDGATRRSFMFFTLGPQLMYGKTSSYGTASNVGVAGSFTWELDPWSGGED